MIGKKVLAYTVAVSVAIGGFWFAQKSFIPGASSVDQIVQLARSLPKIPPEFSYIQDSYQTERQKRVLILDIKKTLKELQDCNASLEDLGSTVLSLDAVRKLDEAVRQNSGSEVWAQHLIDRAGSEFSRTGNERERILRILHSDRKVSDCVLLFPEDQKEVLAQLPGIPSSFCDDIFRKTADEELQKIVGSGTYSSLCTLQVSLYAQGVQLFKARKKESADARVLEVASGLAMVDVGMLILAVRDCKGADDGKARDICQLAKARLETFLADTASAYYNNTSTNDIAYASALVLGARTITQNPASQLFFFTNAEHLSDLDQRIAQDIQQAQQYAPRLPKFKTEAMRLRSELYTELLRFENIRGVLYRKSKEYHYLRNKNH